MKNSWFAIIQFLVASAKDFGRNDIIRLYTPEPPYIDAIRCFTCEKVKDNWECNDNSPDVFCQPGEEFCFSHHEFETSKNGTSTSVRVSKSCKSRQMCQNEQLGCLVDPATGLTVCRECCNETLCNLPLPRNNSNLMAMASMLNNSRRPMAAPLILSLILLFIVH